MTFFLTILGTIISYISYFSAFVLSLSLFSLAIISGIGTFYLFLYINQWLKIYIRWCSNIIKGKSYPSISKHPSLSKKLVFKLKLIVIISLVCFILTFAIGFFSACLFANSMEPWHVWHWFE